MGSGALGALQRYVGTNDVDAVCLSHLHADHFIDMCSFWVARTYSSEGRQPQIPVYGPAATAQRLASANDDPDVTGAFNLVTLTPGRRQIWPAGTLAAGPGRAFPRKRLAQLRPRRNWSRSSLRRRPTVPSPRPVPASALPYTP